MATKNNPGKFDCYKNAKPDEPMFVLLGRDPVAGAVVKYWQRLRKLHGLNKGTDEQIQEAGDCIDAMDEYLWETKKLDPLKKFPDGEKFEVEVTNFGSVTVSRYGFHAYVDVTPLSPQQRLELLDDMGDEEWVHVTETTDTHLNKQFWVFYND